MLIAKPPTNPDKATAYIRVSSQRQADEGVSIEAQEKRIKEYAQFKGLNLDDKDIFIEKAVSGGIPLWGRPKGRQLKQKLMRLPKRIELLFEWALSGPFGTLAFNTAHCEPL